MNKENDKNSVMEKALEKEQGAKIPKISDVVEGKIISVAKNEIHLDIPGFGIGVVRGPELFDGMAGYSNLKIGDKVAATVVSLENEEGKMELSFKRAGKKKAWAELNDYLKDKKTIDAKILEANKGGLLVNINGITGFLPVSQLKNEHYPRVENGNKNEILARLQNYIDDTFKVKVIDVNPEEEKLIVSEKAAMSREQQDALEGLKVGTVVEGKVSGIVDFGAFVKFNENLEGLVHISEIAWKRIDDPRDILKIGQKIKAEIISIDNDRISLSIKKLANDPWKEALKKYKVGQKVEGTVTKVTPFGAFVQLDKKIHGLAHISELSEKLVTNPTDIVKVGEKKEFKIISIEPNEHRLGLSLKALNEKGSTPGPSTKPGAQAKDKGEEKEKKEKAKALDAARAEKGGEKEKPPKAPKNRKDTKKKPPAKTNKAQKSK